MLANCMNLSIPWKGTTLADVNANYVETSIIGGTSKTMYAF